MDMGALGQLTNDAAILLVDQNHFAIAALAYVALAGPVVLGVVCLDVTLALPVRRRLRALKKGCALCQDGLKGVDVFLRDRIRALANGRKLNARKGAALGAQVPSWYQVAPRGLVVDLCRRGEGQVELGREIEVQVKVFFGRLVLAACVAEVGKGRVGGHHQQRQRLRPRGRQGTLLALLDVVGLDAADGIE